MRIRQVIAGVVACVALLLPIAPVSAAGSCRCTVRTELSGTRPVSQELCFNAPERATLNGDVCAFLFLPWGGGVHSATGRGEFAHSGEVGQLAGEPLLETTRCEPYLSADCGRGAAGAVVESPLEFRPVKPRLSFAPPGFSFSDVSVRSLGGSTRAISIPWIGEYIAAIYRFALPVGAILATVVIMVAGLAWITSGGAGQLSTAKDWIQNAILGFVLLLGSYVILNIINPDLVRFTQLQIRFVEQETLTEESEPTEVSGLEPSDIVPVRGTNIIGRTTASADLLPDVQAAATVLEPLGVQLAVTSGYRSEASQRRLILENCQNKPGSDTCNPKPGRPTTCILRRGPASCPHTTGRAVDAWGARDGRQCIRQEDCLKNRAGCRTDACQAAVIAAMRQQGFCNLDSEPWHFEKPKMSANCS